MPTLEVAIRDICTGCAKAGQVVSEVLAAFVARTVRDIQCYRIFFKKDA